MNSDNNESNENYATPMEDGQGHWYSSLTSPDASTSSMASSTITHDMQIKQQLSVLSTEPICISIDSDDSRNEGQQEQQTRQMPSTLTQECLPPLASTPVTASSITIGNPRSERDIENELFQNIETSFREFLRHSNREYPSYRIIRCTIGESPRLEYTVIVVINRPTIILE
jgi:hypothetical protein